MTDEERRCRLVVVGTALKYLTRNLERAAAEMTLARERFREVGTVGTGASKAEYRKAKTRWTAACEAVTMAEAYLAAANRMVAELKEAKCQ